MHDGASTRRPVPLVNSGKNSGAKSVLFVSRTWNLDDVHREKDCPVDGLTFHDLRVLAVCELEGKVHPFLVGG